jgi:sigma-B regulation protein RsbU (phosphoserine phosphatase)
MSHSFLKRTRTSLRLRLFMATVALVAIALGIAAFAFERVARSVVVDAVHSHLTARATEIHDAVQRFQSERALTVRNWAEAEAMQMTLDLGDPKFVEDYLDRVIQDQGGSISYAALIGLDGEVKAAVRAAPAKAQRGFPVPEARGLPVQIPAIYRTEASVQVWVDITPLSRIIQGANDQPVVVLTSTIVDFAGDLCGWVTAIITQDALAKLLADVNGTPGAAAADAIYRPIIADASGRVVVSLAGAAAAPLRAVLAEAKGAPGALQELAPPEGATLLAVRTAAAQDAPGWSTLLVVPEAVAYGRLYWLRLVLAGLFGLVLLGAGFLSIGALRQASQPLTDVSKSMVKVAGGDLSTRVRAEYTDELGHLVRSFNTMVSEVERSRDELKRTEALRREVQIAHQIQTAILPVSPAVKGYEVAARMKPADDVGGDLYDILSFPETFWIIVGDVSGHGINSGLVMMMAQAAAYGAIADDPGCSPKDVITAVNRVIHENVRNRMGRDDYLTLMAARHAGDGRFVAAGAHQPIFISRPGGVDVIQSPGPWVGITAEVPPGVTEYEFSVPPGEFVCLITDGVVEAANGGDELFGEDRLVELLGRAGGASASQVVANIFSTVEAFTAKQADDMTTVVLRRKA